MQESTPFAVIGSNTVVEARGQRVRGRLYPWGIVEGEKLSASCLSKLSVTMATLIICDGPAPDNLNLFPCACAVENPSHCDFVKLRTILIRTHMHDLKDITSDLHYENYRAQCIQTMTRCVCVSAN